MQILAAFAIPVVVVIVTEVDISAKMSNPIVVFIIYSSQGWLVDGRVSRAYKNLLF